MLEKGIPAKDIRFKILNADKPGELYPAIEDFLRQATEGEFSILDISFASRGKELLVVFFYKLP